VKTKSLERPIAGALHPKPRPGDTGTARLNVSEWLQPHDEQAFHIAEKLGTPAAAFLKQKLAVQNPDLVNPITTKDVIEENRFVVSVHTLSNGGVIGLADIEQPVQLRLEVRIQTAAIRP